MRSDGGLRAYKTPHRRQAQAEGFKSAIEWRESCRPISEGDEAKALVASLEKQLAQARAKL